MAPLSLRLPGGFERLLCGPGYGSVRCLGETSSGIVPTIPAQAGGDGQGASADLSILAGVFVPWPISGRGTKTHVEPGSETGNPILVTRRIRCSYSGPCGAAIAALAEGTNGPCAVFPPVCGYGLILQPPLLSILRVRGSHGRENPVPTRNTGIRRLAGGRAPSPLVPIVQQLCPDVYLILSVY